MRKVFIDRLRRSLSGLSSTVKALAAIVALSFAAAPTAAADMEQIARETHTFSAPSQLQLAVSAFVLHREGRAQNDPALLLAAARLRRMVGDIDPNTDPSQRLPDDAAQPTRPMRMDVEPPATAEDMFDAAMAAAGEDQAWRSVIAAAREKTYRKVAGGLVYQLDRLFEGDRATYRQTFLGGEPAGVIVDAEYGDLDLDVYDANGDIVCSHRFGGGIASCEWLPTETQAYRIHVYNQGPGLTGFSLIMR